MSKNIIFSITSMYTQISALELAELIQSKQDIEIIDVREQKEWDIVRLPHAKLIPLSQIQTRSHEIDFGKDVYILCRSGSRSAQVCFWLMQQGKKATNVQGSLKDLYLAGSELLEYSDSFSVAYFA